MKTYQYWDFSNHQFHRTLLAEIDAESIGAADKVLTEKLRAEWQIHLPPINVAWIHVNIKPS